MHESSSPRVHVGRLALLLDSCRYKGLPATLRLALGSLLYKLHPSAFLQFRDRLLSREVARFDRRHGTNTERLAVCSPSEEQHGTGYHPAAEPAFREMMARLPIDHREFTFIDFGSGAGKTLLMASAFPFRRIIGVEVGENLTATARDNLARYHSPAQICHSLDAVHADALEYPLLESPLVLFFFNPFGAELMWRMVDRIEESLRESPRPLYVVYYNPQYPEAFEHSDALQPVVTGVGLQGRWVIYGPRAAVLRAAATPPGSPREGSRSA